MKKAIALFLALVLTLSLVACGTAGTPDDADQSADQQQERVDGTIMFLSNMNSGAQYEGIVAYLEMACENLGYKLEIVFGDPSNDPAGNLTAVQNAMTNDVVGLIAAQDGGLAEIMAEYPELYTICFICDAASVYDEGGANAACLSNDHFLGAMADQCLNGADLAKMYFDVIVEKGYKKIATVGWPPFAYPQFMVADGALRGMIAEYNATAEEPIEVVGEYEALMFQPLSDAYFMDASRQDLDCLVAFAEGITFVYPAMKAAIEAGTVNADIKMVTSGVTSDESVMADFGDEGVISSLINVSVESVVWAIAVLDNAIQGKQYADFVPADRLSSALYVMDSKEDMDLAFSTSLYTGDINNAVTDWETLKTFLTSYNEAATYAALKDYIFSDALTVDGLK